MHIKLHIHKNKSAIGITSFPVATPVFVALFLMFPLCLNAQPDTVHVPTDIPPGEGNLNRAIDQAINTGTLSNTVFVLQPYGYYILTGTITVPEETHLTIVAPEPGSSQETAPPQILWSADRDADDYIFFDCYGDITMKNLWILYADTDGWQVGATIWIREKSDPDMQEKATFENVIFDWSPAPQNSAGAVTVTTNGFVGIFKNCYFKNLTDFHLRYYGRALSSPYQAQDLHIEYVLFENTTFANAGYVFSQEENNWSTNVHVNHCTFLNVVMFTLQSGWWREMSVTNSIFLNTYIIGDIPVEYQHRDRGEPNGGTIRIDSIAHFGFEVPFIEHERRILFAHNSYHIEEWLSDWMENNPFSSRMRDAEEYGSIPRPQPMLSPGTRAFFDSDDFPLINSVALYDSTNPEFVIAPTNQADLAIFLLNKWGYSGATQQWAYKPELSIERIWPMEENLAYTNSTLLNASMSGFPLGDLYRWFPDDYSRWEKQKTSEYNRISQWLETGSDPGPVSVQEHKEISHRFYLSQNFPNPFNPTTRITYSVPHAGDVSLKVYDLLGREVSTLFEGHRGAGTYSAEFDGTGLPSGVYLYRLHTDTVSEVKKLVLLR